MAPTPRGNTVPGQCERARCPAVHDRRGSDVLHMSKSRDSRHRSLRTGPGRSVGLPTSPDSCQDRYTVSATSRCQRAQEARSIAFGRCSHLSVCQTAAFQRHLKQSALRSWNAALHAMSEYGAELYAMHAANVVLCSMLHSTSNLAIKPPQPACRATAWQAEQG